MKDLFSANLNKNVNGRAPICPDCQSNCVDDCGNGCSGTCGRACKDSCDISCATSCGKGAMF